MENEQHPDIFQPTENQYSDLEEETFRRGNSGMTGAGLPKGFISTGNEPLKHFYLQMSRMMCPSVTADSTECEILHILYTRVKKTCKLLKLLDTHPLTDVNPFLIKACSFYLFTDSSDSQKEKRRLNNILYRQTIFTGKISELHDLIAHDLIFFSRIKTNLEEMLCIDLSDPACGEAALPERMQGQ
ncbi:hypothetical protein GPK95_07130 [Odoribacter splanchnicus]|uniref:hypothetical protein n=1 Tax=Odoribacter splanchnicus TaxID=28118 RepID=UPI001C036257|nr:hypothetical protein [Odoribacter splanchnicus]MBT9660539.1 hypothetical protein [Odoribacter splanchnicus]